MKQQVVAEMPSNIALIKYMGKVKTEERNRPTNSSLSLTLNHLLSRVEIEETDGPYDEWQTIESLDWVATQLSERGRKRFLAHFEFLKQKLGVSGRFLVRSANNFPSDCGIASSASSFAALTMATYKLAQLQNPKLDLPLVKIAELSRIGSGSSIRSFLSPLVLWSNTGVEAIAMPYNRLFHTAVIVSRDKKPIGSSDAHERVTSSMLFQNRPERAQMRLSSLLVSLEKKNWREVFEIVWSEFWDMHALFATSSPPFQYMSAGSVKVIQLAFDYWQKHGDGPLVTMDAGENVHLIFRNDQRELVYTFNQMLHPEFQVITGEVTTQHGE